VHVAFATDARYLPWCGVAIRSCLDYADDDLTVHVLHDGGLDDTADAQRLRDMVDSTSAKLMMHTIDPAKTSALPTVDRWGTVVWLRFLLPDLLPDVARVLYLDADTLVVSPLAPLFATDLGSAPFAAVSNVVQPAQRARLLALGLEDYRRTLNSGVLLLDLNQLRAEGTIANLLNVAASRADELVWPDQDALNLVYRGRWHPLHPRWNAQYTLWTSPGIAIDVFGNEVATEARSCPAILHFEGPNLCKPWHALNSHPWRRTWQATLARTPWRGAPDEDRGAATSVLRLLPENIRTRAYWHLVRWRNRGGVAT
jgi:lipopolysaccharide biosynthesis glycosyltransferase